MPILCVYSQDSLACARGQPDLKAPGLRRGRGRVKGINGQAGETGPPLVGKRPAPGMASGPWKLASLHLPWEPGVRKPMF